MAAISLKLNSQTVRTILSSAVANPLTITFNLYKSLGYSECDLIPVSGLIAPQMANSVMPMMGLSEKPIILRLGYPGRKKTVKIQPYVVKDSALDSVIGVQLISEFNFGENSATVCGIKTPLLPIEKSNHCVLPGFEVVKSKNIYSRDDEGYVIVNVDGACLGNGQENAKAGVGVFWTDNHPMNVSRPASKATNNIAEIESMSIAIKAAYNDEISKLQIRSDSKYVINCLTNWIPNIWINNGWRDVRGNQVKNRGLLEELYELYNNRLEDIKLKFVKGHSSDYGNNMADKLAKDGAKRFCNI